MSILKENLVPAKDAGKHLPVQPNSKPTHKATIYRWMKKGIEGVRLESIWIGGTQYTSQEALERFLFRVSEAKSLSQHKEMSSSPTMTDHLKKGGFA